MNHRYDSFQGEHLYVRDISQENELEGEGNAFSPETVPVYHPQYAARFDAAHARHPRVIPQNAYEPNFEPARLAADLAEMSIEEPVSQNYGHDYTFHRGTSPRYTRTTYGRANDISRQYDPQGQVQNAGSSYGEFAKPGPGQSYEMQPPYDDRLRDAAMDAFAGRQQPQIQNQLALQHHGIAHDSRNTSDLHNVLHDSVHQTQTGLYPQHEPIRVSNLGKYDYEDGMHQLQPNSPGVQFESKGKNRVPSDPEKLHGSRKRRQSRNEVVADVSVEDLQGEDGDQGALVEDEDVTGVTLNKGPDLRNLATLYGKGPTQTLDKRFVRQKSPDKFFIPGRVIKVPWPELGGANVNVEDHQSRLYSDVAIFEKIQWFVVVRGGPESCTALPISTHRRKGISKRSNVRRHEYCIIYTGRAPSELPGESTRNDAMSPPIKVKPKFDGDQMEAASRLNFGKTYTIEHNVRVYDFGMVHRSQVDELVDRWWAIMSEPYAPSAQKGAEGSHSAISRETTCFGVDEHAEEASSMVPPKSRTPSMTPKHCPEYVASGEALGNYDPPAQFQQQLALYKHDRLSVQHWTEDGEWATAYNHRSKQTGLVYRTYIKLDRKMVAIYDWSQVPEPTGYVKIRKGDQLGFIASHSDDWSWVWKPATKEKGLLPSNYIRKSK